MPPRVDNLRESAHRVVRLVALGHLADAASARERLGNAKDDEALHDFRVALRRLRSWERAFRPYIRDDVSKRLRQRLRNLARDTGASRDLEVHLVWLREQRRTLGRRQRPGLTWLLANLHARKEDADAVLEDDVESRFTRLRSKLGERTGVVSRAPAGARQRARVAAGSVRGGAGAARTRRRELAAGTPRAHPLAARRGRVPRGTHRGEATAVSARADRAARSRCRRPGHADQVAAGYAG